MTEQHTYHHMTKSNPLYSSWSWICSALLLLASGTVFGQDTSTAEAIEAAGNKGDTAWMLTATALVLFMTIPGLALFYGGLVHKRNVLSVLMHCLALTAALSITWLVLGYSLAIGTPGGWCGGFGNMFHNNVGSDDILNSAFQMTFFIITPALIVGTFVERIKFSAMLVFSILWALFVYAPICHITWFGDGVRTSLFTQWGVEDLAGGIVVHITAGVAALVACIMVGKRNSPKPPHNLTMTVTGTAMLWVGWFGFNAGSQGGASSDAAMTLFVTHISASTAAFTWMMIEWYTLKKPSVLGIATGAIAGLAAITPASGVAGPMGALLIGAVSGSVCWWASVRLKNKLGYDDSLDVVGVHGVGGLVGTLLAAVVGTAALGGVRHFDSAIRQFGIQLGASMVTIAYTTIVTIAILLFVKKVCNGLRVSEEEERLGLDQTSHGESGYTD